MDRKVGLAIIAIAILAAAWAIFPRAIASDVSRALLSDLPGHYMVTSTEGPCQSRVGSSTPVIYVQLRANPDGSATLYAHQETWPMMPQPLLVSGEGGNPLRPAHMSDVVTMTISVPLTEHAEAWENLMRVAVEGADTRCILFRADQSASASDVYSIGMAMQNLPNTQLLIFPELAMD